MNEKYNVMNEIFYCVLSRGSWISVQSNKIIYDPTYCNWKGWDLDQSVHLIITLLWWTMTLWPLTFLLKTEVKIQYHHHSYSYHNLKADKHQQFESSRLLCHSYKESTYQYSRANIPRIPSFYVLKWLVFSHLRGISSTLTTFPSCWPGQVAITNERKTVISALHNPVTIHSYTNAAQLWTFHVKDELMKEKISWDFVSCISGKTQNTTSSNHHTI